MVKLFKFKPKVLWGLETLEGECNCDLDNSEIKNKQLFKSEEQRNAALNKWLEETNACVKQYNLFCTNINETV